MALPNKRMQLTKPAQRRSFAADPPCQAAWPGTNMEASLTLLLVGGLISLVSTLAGVLVTHWFELKRASLQVKQHPTRVIYVKQTEFFDKAAPILYEVNGYISAIDVWLEEKGKAAREQLRRASANNQALTRLHELVECYYLYLPRQILERANELFFECLDLGRRPSPEGARKCIDLLFSFQNSIREVVGVDSVSRDLLKAFGPARQRELRAWGGAR